MPRDRFRIVVNKEEPPSLTIDANDPSFIPMVKEYQRRLGSRIDIEVADRDKEIEQLGHLISRARHWQEDNQVAGTRPTLDLKKRHWGE